MMETIRGIREGVYPWLDRTDWTGKASLGTSLVVQWLRLFASTDRGSGSIHGQGTKIPCATHCGQKKPPLRWVLRPRLGGRSRGQKKWGLAFQAQKEVHAKVLRLPQALVWRIEKSPLRTSGNCNRVAQDKEQLEVTEDLTSDILALLGLLFGGWL